MKTNIKKTIIIFYVTNAINDIYVTRRSRKINHIYTAIIENKL
jgi:hypothetical protein